MTIAEELAARTAKAHKAEAAICIASQNDIVITLPYHTESEVIFAINALSEAIDCYVALSAEDPHSLHVRPELFRNGTSEGGTHLYSILWECATFLCSKLGLNMAVCQLAKDDDNED